MTNKAKEYMAEARTIHLAMRDGAIPYMDAKRLTKPLLEEVNRVARKIGKKYGIRPREITFQDLGRNL
jgi:flagellar biosynthesis component FlhA